VQYSSAEDLCLRYYQTSSKTTFQVADKRVEVLLHIRADRQLSITISIPNFTQILLNPLGFVSIRRIEGRETTDIVTILKSRRSCL